VEAKIADETSWPPLKYFKEKLNIPFAYQVVDKPNVDRLAGGIRTVSAGRFLSSLI
jgi:hypothetical protein